MTATLDAPARPGDPGADAGGRPPRPVPAALTAWRDPHPGLGWGLTLAVAALAALTRFWSLGFPPAKIFDEIYYATEAQEVWRFGYEDNRGYMFIVHPPLGKWLIGLTSAIWGNNSFGWRVAPAVAGVVAVIVMVRIARRMFRSDLFGVIAGLLLTMDGVSLVLSRTALLDAFLETFVLAAFGALVLDREQVRARLGRLVADGADLTDGAPTLGPRPWRFAAGVLFGLACGIKWTALSFFVLFVVASVVWDRGALKAAGVRRPSRTMWWRSAVPGLGSLVATPFAVYLFTYLGWFTGENGWGRHWTDTHGPSARLDLLGLRVPFSWAWVPDPIRALGAYTLQAYRFHETLYTPHTYQSSPWSWLVLGRPVDFYYDGTGTACGASSCSREILLIGTPLMWWAIVPMLLWLAWHWSTTRDWRAAAVWVAFAAGWCVWFQDLKRTMFLFYMAPLMPFLVLGLTLGLGVLAGSGTGATGGGDAPDAALLRRRRWGVAAVAAYLGLVVADFVWMWPIYTGGLLTYAQWHAHMWLPSWV